jgi:D-serine deaminase-like pyridoxal phosphate-dependent protein
VVSTLTEAEMYAQAGFDDILYGYPLLEQHMERNTVLTKMLNNYHVMVSNLESIGCLLNHCPPCGKKWYVVFSAYCSCTSYWWIVTHWYLKYQLVFNVAISI